MKAWLNLPRNHQVVAHRWVVVRPQAVAEDGMVRQPSCVITLQMIVRRPATHTADNAIKRIDFALAKSCGGKT